MEGLEDGKGERVVGSIGTIATNKDDVDTIMGTNMITGTGTLLSSTDDLVTLHSSTDDLCTLSSTSDDLDQRKSKLPVIVRRPLRFPDPALLPNWPDFQVTHAIPPTLPTVQKARKLSTRSLVAKLMDIHKDSPSLDDMTVQMALGWSGPNRNLYPESRRSLSESWHAHPAAKDTGGAARERVEMTIGERKKRPPPIQ